MAKASIRENVFVPDIISTNESSCKISFWRDGCGKNRQAWKQMLEQDSEHAMARPLGLDPYEQARGEGLRQHSRNGRYERGYSTILGSIRLRVCGKDWRHYNVGLGVGAADPGGVSEGILTRQVDGRVVALIIDEPVSRTVSDLTRCLEQQVQQFHTRRLSDGWAYLFLHGVWLKLRRADGPQKMLLLVASVCEPTENRQLLALLRAKSESQALGEGY